MDMVFCSHIWTTSQTHILALNSIVLRKAIFINCYTKLQNSWGEGLLFILCPEQLKIVIIAQNFWTKCYTNFCIGLDSLVSETFLRSYILVCDFSLYRVANIQVQNVRFKSRWNVTLYKENKLQHPTTLNELRYFIDSKYTTFLILNLVVVHYVSHQNLSTR